MQRLGLDFWLQPLADEFQSEYPPARAQRLALVTGFTGSAGLAVIRSDGKKHALFVDGRYTLQASLEVDPNQFDCINSGNLSLIEWLKTNVQSPTTIGVDPWLITQNEWERWQLATAPLPLRWQAISPNPLDALWDPRPPVPNGEVTLHSLEYAGEPYVQKRDVILRHMQREQADVCLLTLPDGINWLLNIRGADVPYNPLLLCYFVMQADGSAMIYSYSDDFSADVRSYFAAQSIAWRSIDEIFTPSQSLFAPNTRVMTDPTNAAHGFWQRAEKEGWSILAQDDPIALPKACKNTVELRGIHEAHIKDGLAVTRFLYWLDTQCAAGYLCDELEIIAQLEQFRRMDAGYLGGSFPTIAGAGEHGAIIHYRADEHSNRKLRAGELLLLDSGGQYRTGTTDITRTIFIPSANGGKPSALLREDFTRVLKGHIALASIQFPRGTTGSQLDVLARQFLWQAGLDYDHGTGHGVGAYLCVHEGPQRISKRASNVALCDGMILSNEPGVYRNGQHGIRIENLVAVIRAVHPYQEAFLQFETVTLAPIDCRLIDVTMLNSQERNWLNAYHQRVYKTFEPLLGAQEKSWLASATRAI